MAMESMDDLLGRMKYFSLTRNEDSEVDLRDQNVDNFLSHINIQQCVVGKVLLAKKLNTDAFRSVMIAIWRVHNSKPLQRGVKNA